MKTTRVEAKACRECGKVRDAISDFETENVPRPGDVSICLGCGVLSILGDDLEDIPPTDEETLELLADPKIKRMLAAMAELRRRHQ